MPTAIVGRPSLVICFVLNPVRARLVRRDTRDDKVEVSGVPTQQVDGHGRYSRRHEDAAAFGVSIHNRGLGRQCSYKVLNVSIVHFGKPFARASTHGATKSTVYDPARMTPVYSQCIVALSHARTASSTRFTLVDTCLGERFVTLDRGRNFRYKLMVVQNKHDVRSIGDVCSLSQ